MRSTDNYMDVSALSEGVYIIKLENRSGDRFSTRLIRVIPIFLNNVNF